MQALSITYERIIHSIKTALACLIGFIIAETAKLPAGQWLVITTLVVMCAQINVGSMLQKSYMRFFGTVLGSLIAGLTLLFIGADPISNAIVVVAAAVFFSYLATSQTSINEAGTLGAVTVALVLASANPTPITAIERCLEISAGILIAALVSQFVLPIHARNLLRRTQAKTFRQLRDYYRITLINEPLDNISADYFDLDIDITKSIVAQRQLAREAAREPNAKKSVHLTQFTELLRYERKILRSITFMHYAYRSYHEKKIFSAPAVKEFHEMICNEFERIALYLESNDKKIIAMDHMNIQSLKHTILAERNNLTSDDTTNVDAYLFSAGVLVASMNELIELVR